MKGRDTTGDLNADTTEQMLTPMSDEDCMALLAGIMVEVSEKGTTTCLEARWVKGELRGVDYRKLRPLALKVIAAVMIDGLHTGKITAEEAVQSAVGLHSVIVGGKRVTEDELLQAIREVEEQMR